MQKEPSWFALLLNLVGYATKALELKTLGWLTMFTRAKSIPHCFRPTGRATLHVQTKGEGLKDICRYVCT
jgi:hypothetical protein